MKIALNALYYREPPTGISRYTRHLMHWLPRMDTRNEYFFFVAEKYGSEAWDSTVIPLPVSEGFSVNRTLNESRIFRNMIRKYDIDIFHSPHFILPTDLPCLRVMTIHDTAVFEFPHYFPWVKRVLWNWKVPGSCRQSDHLIVDSEAIKSKLPTFFPDLQTPVSVIPLGINTKITFPHITENTREIMLPRPFMLFVGTISPRKNLIRLINTFHQLVTDYALPHHLVLVGKHGFWEKKYRAELDTCIANNQLHGKVLFLHEVNDRELPDIYRKADVLIHPSLGEGFGLPVLEAMAYGIPVAVSADSSLPELVENAGVLFNPYSEKEMAASIFKLLDDKDFREECIARGFERAQGFTWKTTAEKTIKVYEETFTNKP